MFPLAERMKLVSESITLAVSAKANAMKKAGVDPDEAARRYELPERFAHFEVFSWDWCIGDALRSFYRQQGNRTSRLREQAATMPA